jgi:hypothetical protein
MWAVIQHFISPTVQNHHKTLCGAASFKDNTKFHKFRIMRVVIQHFISQQLKIITKTCVVRKASKTTQNFMEQISNNADHTFHYKLSFIQWS